jgi:tetratricopeptide (TPR) repeat protein
MAKPDVQDGYVFTMLNTLSLCYLNSDKLDSAEYYLKKVYALAAKKDDTLWKGIISGNMGMLCFKYKKYDEALRWFQQEIESFKGKPSMNVANTYAIQAEIYIAKNEKEKALQLALAAYDILRQMGDYKTRYDANGIIYSGLSKAHAAIGDMDKAYRFLDSATVAREIVGKKQNAHILAGITYKISANERLVEQQQYDRNVRNNAILKYILIGALVLLVIITILLINRQKLKYSFSQKQLEAEKQHIESELDIATQQLNTLVGSISDKNELIERFTKELDQLREHLSDERLNKADEALTHLQKATIITDEEWAQFAQTFDKVHKGFLKRLNDKVRGLSPIETKFMMLSKMKLSTNEVAAALGISQESVRLNRKRLYTKLNLTEGEQSLQTLIDSI